METDVPISQHDLVSDPCQRSTVKGQKRTENIAVACDADLHPQCPFEARLMRALVWLSGVARVFFYFYFEALLLSGFRFFFLCFLFKGVFCVRTCLPIFIFTVLTCSVLPNARPLRQSLDLSVLSFFRFHFFVSLLRECFVKAA